MLHVSNSQSQQLEFVLFSWFLGCGHCKHTKPEFTAAANAMQDDPRVAFVAIDCTKYVNLCAKYNVRGYPTFIYFSYLKTKLDYNGGRNSEDFIAYMKNPPSPKEHSEL